jgi:hypothetical protein
MKIIFFLNCIFVLLDAGPPVFPKDPIYSQQVQWAGVCPGRPALPYPYPALLEDNDLEMQA